MINELKLHCNFWNSEQRKMTGPGRIGSRVTHRLQNVGRVGSGQSLCGSGRVGSGPEKVTRVQLWNSHSRLSILMPNESPHATLHGHTILTRTISLSDSVSKILPIFAPKSLIFPYRTMELRDDPTGADQCFFDTH